MRTTGAAFLTSSAAVKARPICGRTPSAAKKSQSARAEPTRSASRGGSVIVAFPSVAPLRCSNECDCACQSRRSGREATSFVVPLWGSVCQTITRCDGSGNGSGWKTTLHRTLKIEVVAPMPSMSVSKAAKVKARERASARMAYRMSLTMEFMALSLLTQDCHRQRLHGAAHRQHDGENDYRG